MPMATVSTCKFVGVVSLGLLTGLSYTTAAHTLPALLYLPSASTAHSTFVQLRRTTRASAARLAATAATSLLLAFALSPSRARHPYLLWSSLVLGISAASDLLPALGAAPRSWSTRHIARHLPNQQAQQLHTEEEDVIEVSGEDSDQDGISGGAVNGEQVQRAMEKFRASQTLRTVVQGFAFGIAVIGIWGDSFRVARQFARRN